MTQRDATTSFLRENLWNILTTGALLLILGGQWVERSNGGAANTANRLSSLEGQVVQLQSFHAGERLRLDAVYMPREVIASQNAEILRRLESLETQLNTVLKRVGPDR